jgi:TatD DNase family protein
MKIDIHRHAKDKGTADRVVRNLFPDQIDELDTDGCYSVGLHPWYVADETLDEGLKKVWKSTSNNRVIAIGEVGLDKAVEIPWATQKKAFESQIRFAVDSDKPVIIHCVRAYQEILQERIKTGHKQPWIIHWFNASLQTGQQLIDKGFYLSFGHMLFNEGSKAFQAFPYIPLERIFFETDDAGFSISEVYERASQLRNMKLVELELQIVKNFYSCFKINP